MHHYHHSRRGSVLMVALVLGLALAILVSSYLTLSLSSLRSSERSFHYNTAFNLAEAGLEEALWALNHEDWTKQGWTESGANRVLTGSFESPNLTGSNVTGYFNVFVSSATTGRRQITAEAVVRPFNGHLIRKQLRVEAHNANIFMPPFTAITRLDLNGGEIDSYRMDANGDGVVDAADSLDNNSDGFPDGSYQDTRNRRYGTTVASPTVEIGDIDIGSPADIYGYVTVGVDLKYAADFVNGVKGSIVGSTTTAGQDGVVAAGSNLVDTNRIAYDFDQTFEMPEYPAWSRTALARTDAGTKFTLPAPDANGFIRVGDSTGTTTEYYILKELDIPNGQVLLVQGPTEIVVATASTVPLQLPEPPALGSEIDEKDFLKYTIQGLTTSGDAAITVSGQAALTVQTGDFSVSTTTGNGQNKVTTTTEYKATNASLKLYASGDTAISGNGAVGGALPGTNIGRDPTKLQIFGVPNADWSAISFDIGGNGDFAAALYAPKADVKFNGGGSSGYFAGATVANTITVNGNGYRVRFPEEMADMNTATTYQVSRWVELTDRSTWHDFGN